MAAMTKTEITTLINTNLADTSNITAVEHRAVENALLNYAESQWLPGDIKEIDCTDQYIVDNFDGTGLGINERLGWAICNGQNGTKDRSGKVSVAYGSGYSTMGATGGASTHTLTSGEMPAHNHLLVSSQDGGVAVRGATGMGSKYLSPNNLRGQNDEYNLFGVDTAADRVRSSTAGSGGAHNNMQPYIVTLFIQKL